MSKVGCIVINQPGPAEELRSFLKEVDPESALQMLHQSDATPKNKCDIAMNIIKFVGGERTTELFLGLRDTIFADAEARAYLVAQSFNLDLSRLPGIAGPRDQLGAAAGLLASAALLLDPVSSEAGRELLGWVDFFKEMRDNCQPRKSYHCAHCSAERDDMFAVMDGWILCLTTSDGTPSCFTRVHDRGEPLGSGSGAGQN